MAEDTNREVDLDDIADRFAARFGINPEQVMIDYRNRRIDVPAELLDTLLTASDNPS